MKAIAFLLGFALLPQAIAEESNEVVQTNPTSAVEQKVAARPTLAPTGVATADLPNQVTAQAAPPTSKAFGLLDLRPSVATNNGVLRSENTIEAGYQFTSDTRLTYTQWWNTTKNLSEGIFAHDGFFRLRVNNLYKAGPVSVNYQGRLFLPTYAVRREAGYVGGLFNQLAGAVQLTPALNLSLSVAPQIQHFSRTSHNGKPNTALQNFTVLNLDIQLAEPLLLSLPVYFISTKARTAAGLPGSSDWSHLVVVWPELAYTISKVHTVGLSYYSDNMVNSAFTQLTLGNAFSYGVLQAFWTVRL